MPIYEYRCPACRYHGSRLQKMSDPTQPDCPRCGTTMVKQISRVAFLEGEEARAERLADPSAWGDFDENDPRSMGRMMRRMGEEMGEEMDDEFREAVERLEAGEDPDSIEGDLGDGGGAPPMGGGGGWLD